MWDSGIALTCVKVLGRSVGAGVVVTNDVEAGMVVGGNPATVIKPRC